MIVVEAVISQIRVLFGFRVSAFWLNTLQKHLQQSQLYPLSCCTETHAPNSMRTNQRRGNSRRKCAPGSGGHEHSSADPQRRRTQSVITEQGKFIDLYSRSSVWCVEFHGLNRSDLKITQVFMKRYGCVFQCIKSLLWNLSLAMDGCAQMCKCFLILFNILFAVSYSYTLFYRRTPLLGWERDISVINTFGYGNKALVSLAAQQQ